MSYYDSGNGGGDFFGGNGWLGLIALAAIFGFGNGNGLFGRGGSSGTSETIGYELGKAATASDVAVGFSTSAQLNGLNDIKLGQAGIQQTLCQGFSGVNQAISNSGYETRSAISDLGYNLQNCCCQTQRAIDGVNYNLASNTCSITNAINNSTRDIIDSQRNGTSAILNFLTNEKISSLQAENSVLRGQLSQNAQTDRLLGAINRTPQPAYVVPNPYCCYSQCGMQTSIQ